MALPITYRRYGEAGIASYDYTNIATGIGTEIFYPAETSSGAYILSPNIIFSHRSLGTISHSADAAWAEKGSFAFSSAFNFPRIIKGDVLLNIPMGLRSQFTSEVYYYYPQVTLYQLDGRTNQLIKLGVITSGAIRTTPSIANQTFDFAHYALKINVGKTKLKKNDSLRVDIALWTRSNSGHNANVMIGHDPQNRTSGAFDIDAMTTGTINYRTDTQVHVPFVIDL